MRNRLKALAGSLAIVAMVTTAACSSDAAESPTTSDPAGSSAAEPAADKSTVTIVQGAGPSTLDPLQHREQDTTNILQHIYDPLFMRSATDPNDFVPMLAESWERTDDRTLRVNLRKGVQFSDGNEFNSEDVDYTFKYLLGQLPDIGPTVSADQFKDIESVKVVDDFAVDIVTKAPDALLLQRLTFLPIVADGAVDEDPEALAKTPNGTGPYTLEEWDRNNQVVLKAKDSYFRGAPEIDEVVFKQMAQAPSRRAALVGGSADLIVNVDAANIDSLESNEGISVKSAPSGVYSIWLDTLSEGPLQSPKVRQAINHAVNVEAIAAGLMGDRATPVATIVPPHFADYDPDIAPLGYNPEKAKELLTEAGYPDGFEFEIMVPTGHWSLAEDICQALSNDLAKVGITMKVNVVEYGVFANATNTREVGGGFFAAWGGAFFNPLDELEVAIVSDGGFSWYKNSTVDSLFEKAASTLDDSGQTEAVSAIQKELLQDPPFIFLFSYSNIYGVSDKLDWEPAIDGSIYMYGASVKN